MIVGDENVLPYQRPPLSKKYFDGDMSVEQLQLKPAQSKIAALSICGKHTPYEQVPWFWSDQFNVKLQTVGLCQGYNDTVVRGDPDSRKFAVFNLREGRLIATDAINSPAEFMVSKRLVAAGASPDPAQLADPDVPLKSLL